MKKMIMAVLVLASSFYATVQAGTGGKARKAAKKETVSQLAKESFERQFPQAQYASWQPLYQHDLYLVRFVDNQVGAIAYVNMEGAVVAVARNIQKQNLPSTVTRVLETQYANAEVTETLELVLSGELNYLISLETEKAKISLKVSANGHSTETKREKLSKKAF